MKQSQNIIILHLSLIDGVGSATIKKIAENKPPSLTWDDLYRLDTQELINSLRISASVAERLCKGLQDTQLLNQELDLIEEHCISWTTLVDDNYPQLLSHINVPPAVLYWRGNVDNMHENNLAIVGSRKADAYAVRVIAAIVPQLVALDWTIVSGGAIGADTLAHQATVQSQGKTIAVLGSGLLFPYPQKNSNLFEKIIKNNGAIVSAFPLKMIAQPGNFPARNRIIAGLSKGCLVVQAAQKSGACITAHYALEQGRDVFAVPGRIGDELSAGCNALIQEGAKLVTGVHDILQEYGYFVDDAQKQATLLESQLTPLTVTTPSITQAIINELPHSLSAQFPKDSTEAKIIHACAHPLSVDELIQKTSLSLLDLQDKLFSLQLDGYIKQDFTGMWVVNG